MTENDCPESACRQIASRAAGLAVLAEMNGQPELAARLKRAAEEAERISQTDSPSVAPEW